MLQTLQAAADLTFEAAGPLKESVTLRNAADPTSAPVTLGALFPSLTLEERLGPEAGTQKCLLRVSELGAFTVNGSTTVERAGLQRRIADDLTRTAGTIVAVFLRSGG